MSGENPIEPGDESSPDDGRCLSDESVHHDGSPLQRADRIGRPISVWYVDDDSQYLSLIATTLERGDQFDVRTDSSTGTRRVPERIDCVVYGGLAAEDGVALFETIREREPDLPFVLFTDDGREQVFEHLERTRCVDYVHKGDDEVTLALLERRITALVERHRDVTLLRRALLAIETTQDGVAIAGPNGTFEFVDRVFAAEFGYDWDELRDQPWDAVFADDEAARLRSTAIPMATDGWHWTGECVARRKRGATATVRTHVGGLEDGSLVFVVSGTNGSN